MTIRLRRTPCAPEPDEDRLDSSTVKTYLPWLVATALFMEQLDATVSRLGAVDIAIANRTEARAARLAELYGGRVVPSSSLQEEIAAADVLISCTGAAGVVLTLGQVEAGPALVHVAYLLVLTAVGWWWAVRRLSRRMSS